jgi:peptidase E
MLVRSKTASPAYHPPGGFMPDATSEKQDRMLADHEKLLANQAQILEGLEMIKSNQAKLDQILANQEKILGSVGS